jgi:hypothetical protein
MCGYIASEASIAGEIVHDEQSGQLRRSSLHASEEPIKMSEAIKSLELSSS